MSQPHVSVGIVTWNSVDEVEACVRSVRAQTWQALELRVLDNASSDQTWARLEAVTTPEERRRSATNLGFSAGHNRLIESTNGTYYLALNPDVELTPRFVQTLVEACEAEPRAGSASGKLLRFSPPDVIDTTGMVMLPSQRHLDRGADHLDRGQYDRGGFVFGASGAAAFYRRKMLLDVQVVGECFDEDFFAYREDADLAWRAQLQGWTCLYVPEAVARHRRRVTPERRAALAPEINRYSVRNRFLLRIKNQTWPHARTFLVPALVRDAQVVGYVLCREWSSLPGLVDVWRLLPRMLAKRRVIQSRRRVSEDEMAHWFRQGVEGASPTGARSAVK